MQQHDWTVDMAREHHTHQTREGKYTSTHKPLRTVLLAVLFHTYWPKRLSRDELIDHLSSFYGSTPVPAFYRDLETLTGMPVEMLPEPGTPQLAEWCAQQKRLKRLAITYERSTGTFALAQS